MSDTWYRFIDDLHAIHWDYGTKGRLESRESAESRAVKATYAALTYLEGTHEKVEGFSGLTYNCKHIASKSLPVGTWQPGNQP